MARGRPSGQMTNRRRQVLATIISDAEQGVMPSLASLARRCGLYDYREARRIVADLRKLGHDAAVKDTGAGIVSASTLVTANRIRTANRRAAWFGAADKLTVEEVCGLMADQQERCALCAIGLTAGFHIDHKTSLRVGGANTIDNIQLLCPPCNIAKG